ncbi:MAG TPA: NERD domain-containing protein [Streptosporangiaceae bacterium]
MDRIARPGTSGAPPGPAGPGDPESAAADLPEAPDPADLADALDPADLADAPGRPDDDGPDEPEASTPGDPDGAGVAAVADDSDGGIVTAGDRHPAHEHPLSSFAADPRMPIWIRRAVIAAAIGVVVGILVDWRLGLTAAAIVAILDTVHRSRTTAVIPAAVRVTSAQRRTRRRLLWARRSGYLTLNARAIPGTNCIIDHLIVGPAGVFAVDSERWDRRLPLRATQGGHLYHGPYTQTSRLKHAQLEAGLAGRLISESLGRKQRIRPAMVIYGPTVPWTVARISGVDVFSGRRLRKYLRAQSRARREQRLTHEEIEQILSAAETALPAR